MESGEAIKGEVDTLYCKTKGNRPVIHGAGAQRVTISSTRMQEPTTRSRRQPAMSVLLLACQRGKGRGDRAVVPCMRRLRDAAGERFGAR